MKNKFFSFLMMTICLTLIASALVSCNNDFKGTAPVYQGMTISKLSDKQASLNTDKPELNVDNNNIDGDHNDKDDDINQDKPFEDEPTIEDKVDDTLNVGGAERDIYYADPNEEILIAINIHNPDSYEILSFTLNGKKYQSFEFQDGSNSEKLLLKLNVGASAGIVNYTIDSIKYIVNTDIKDVIMDGNKTVKAGVRGTGITNVEISQEKIGLRDISFSAKINDEYNLINSETGFVKAVLYNGKDLIKTIDLALGDNTIKFDSLNPNTLYEYAIVAKFDDFSGSGTKANVIKTKAFYTNAIVLFDKSKIIVTQTSVAFDFVWDSQILPQNQTIESFSLYLDDKLVSREISKESKIIDNLLSDRTYKIVANYKNLTIDESIFITTKTQAKITPVVEINNIVATKTEIDFGIKITDTDRVGNLSSVQLFKGSELVEDLADVTLRKFSNLLSDTSYTIKATYKYNLNNGAGEQTIVVESSCYTAPVLEIINVETINTSAVSIGEKVVLQANINNPGGHNITKAVINGVTYNVSSLTSATNVRVEIMVDNTFGGGDTNFIIESLFATVHNKEIEFLFAANNSSTCFINGELVVEKIEMINSKNQVCDVLFNGEENYVLVTLKNSTGYNIDGLTLSGWGATSIIKIDNNHYKVPLGYTNGNVTISLTQIVYSNANLGQKTKNISDVSCQVTVVTSEPVQIKTAQDLKNMRNMSNYKLMNDIDLAGIEWSTPNDFNGYFDGNDKTISNLKCVKTFTDSNVTLGLFAYASGVIKNLKLDNVLIMATCNKSASGIDIGGIAAASTMLTISNCSVTGDISGTGENPAVGGLVGRAKGITVITDSYTTGNINGNSAGGLIGYTYGLAMTITNCYTTGDISGSFVGGLIGSELLSDGNCTITNCYTTGNINGGGNSAGGLIGEVYDSITITNCYTYAGQIIKANDFVCDGAYSELSSKCSLEQLNSPEFYTVTLKWDSDIWNFTNLDFAKSSYPTLK